MGGTTPYCPLPPTTVCYCRSFPLTALARLAKLPNMQEPNPNLIRYFDALASGKRLLVLDWLSDPEAHFPPQVHGDLVQDGVCGLLIAEKLGISQSTVSRHMKQLVDVGLVDSKKIKQWTFYRRDEAAIKSMKKLIGGV